MRKKSNATPPESLQHRELAVVEQKRTYDLITPLYGGGVKANEADPITVVRATEIRGQLRFWWRAMRGGRFNGDLAAMQQEEGKIWGKAYKKDDKGIPPDQTIQLVVDITREGTPIKPLEMRGPRPVAINDIPGYVAFPLQPDQKERKNANPVIPDVRQGVQFTLTISYPEHLRTEIEAALWAWETFGGLGARTRRGFGALHLVMIDGKQQPLLRAQAVKSSLEAQAKKYNEASNFPKGIPHLGSTLQIAVTPPSRNPMEAWNRLIRKLQNFRQQKDASQRSAWPEADTIRQIAKKGPAAAIKKFPRAAFGLPIIFHFTGKNAPDGDYTLNEAKTVTNAKPEDRPNKERFASPLILRPFLCADKQAVGIAIVLEGSRVNLNNLVLQDGKRNLQSVNGKSTLDGSLTTAEARSLTTKIPELKNETDLLQAFLKSF